MYYEIDETKLIFIMFGATRRIVLHNGQHYQKEYNTLTMNGIFYILSLVIDIQNQMDS